MTLIAAPLTPTVTNPWGGQVITASIANTFTWQSDGSQASFFIEWKRNITGAIASNTGWQTSSLSQYEFAANTFTNTYEYAWRVKTRNSAGQESPFSDWAVFRAGNVAELTITFPVNDMDVLSSVPVYQHVYNSPNGYYQVAYQYKLFTGTTWNDIDAMTAAEQESYTWDQLEALSQGNVLWDSGRVEGTATSVDQPSDKLLSLQYWYKVQVTIWDNAGNEVTSAIRTFGLLVDSIPRIPTLSATPDPDNGRNIATIINLTPAPGQVAVTHNRLYRRRIDGTWELIQDNIPITSAKVYSLVMQPSHVIGYLSSLAYDNTCRSSKEEEYAVSAVGTNGIESSKSKSAFATCRLNAYWFTNLETNETVKLNVEPRFGRMQSERNREEYVGVDEQYPQVNYDYTRFYRGSFQARLFKPTNMSFPWPSYIAQIRQVLDTTSPVLFRSPHGDLFKFNISDLQIKPWNRVDSMREISFNMTEIEEVVPAGGFGYEMPPNDLRGYWVIDPTTGLGFRLYAEPQWDGINVERDRVEVMGLSSEFPEVGYGTKQAARGGFSGLIMRPRTGTLSEEVMKLRELVDGKTKAPVLFRGMSGDVLLVDTYGFSFELFDRINQARRVSFEYIEIGGI